MSEQGQGSKFILSYQRSSRLKCDVPRICAVIFSLCIDGRYCR